MSATTPLPHDSRPRVAFDKIELAADRDDLDEAVRLIQAELGQPDGDIAAAFFDDERSDNWIVSDHAERVKILQAYVAFEETFA